MLTVEKKESYKVLEKTHHRSEIYLEHFQPLKKNVA